MTIIRFICVFSGGRLGGVRGFGGGGGVRGPPRQVESECLRSGLKFKVLRVQALFWGLLCRVQVRPRFFLSELAFWCSTFGFAVCGQVSLRDAARFDDRFRTDMFVDGLALFGFEYIGANALQPLV